MSTVGLKINRLRCEYQVNPLSIDDTTPRLSWIIDSTGRGVMQTAYRIIAATSPDVLSANRGDLWDTGRIESDTSVHVVYKGKVLASRQRCWWKVKVWDNFGNKSVWSEPARWEMGLPTVNDWQGKWIGLAGYERSNLMPSPHLRRIFQIDGEITHARLYATARGVYQLSLNGQRIHESILPPGWTDYDHRIQYQTYDVTHSLQSGDNALGAILGTGWFAGYVGFQMKAKNYGASPSLLLQLHIEYADGKQAVIVSDENWKAATGAICYSDMLMGESYDAREALTGWDTKGYDDSGWQGVVSLERDTTPLVADRAEPVLITENRTPKSVTSLENGSLIVDMGQNMVGWVRLNVRGQAGTEIKLRFAEILNADGTIYTENLRTAKQTDTYILSGNGEEIFEPLFTFHGFRYVEVTGYPGELLPSAILGCVIQSATPTAGTFECSNAMVNQLQRNIVWGQRGNFLSVPTDCPQRDERLGWLGDAQVFIRTATYNADVAAFFTKWMWDVVDGQSALGGFPDVAPRLVDLADGAPAWGDAGIIVPWTLYQVYGDKHLIEQHWGAMEAWMHYLHKANPSMIRTAKLNNNFGDWLSIKANTPTDAMATAYWAYDATLMVQIAQSLGLHERADYYQNIFESVREAFNRAYVKEGGFIDGDTQTMYVLALHMNLLPESFRPLAASRLVENIEAREGHLSTGFVGVSYLNPVLTQAGYNDTAYRLLLNDTFPSWGYSIKHGATTIWERWDGWTEEKGFQDAKMNSFNHYSLGSVGQWLFQTVGGIDIGAPGYKHILIQPQPGGGLTYARAEYESMYGKIVSAWTIQDEQITLKITIPTNTTATLRLPPTIQALDTAVAEANGLQVLSESGTYVLASGDYHLTLPIPTNEMKESS